MTSIEQIARQYRGIRCNHIAQGLADLLRQAEANEVSYLALRRGPWSPMSSSGATGGGST